HPLARSAFNVPYSTAARSIFPHLPMSLRGQGVVVTMCRVNQTPRQAGRTARSGNFGVPNVDVARVLRVDEPAAEAELTKIVVLEWRRFWRTGTRSRNQPQLRSGRNATGDPVQDPIPITSPSRIRG